MNLEEFAQLLGKSLQEAEEVLKNEEIITLNLREKKILRTRENFKMEIMQ